ncbi:gas vesicle protein GvpG [Fictibacillus fluitans]|uniref:Gas vesicle protein GvpG n=1 Tax=Fictibacillus fluitans TaxID=3058422 RepID=A0ABT8HVY4_9BACL|nr:gas vesicle protein GvpG [Fictibacillus sp. NE201]MDN4524943.1 gas vesicle protein GvpG [Fictibacillus sp. NE201]
MIHKLFTLPIRSIIKLGEKIQEEVDEELYSIPHIQQQLVQLHTMFEMEQMDEESYLAREQELLDRYRIAKEREKQN